jgi:acetylornithine deacetylase/succinyl-diaminopimelate desuccinylase-like protein
MLRRTALLACALTGMAFAQTPPRQVVLDEFFEFLRIPNTANDPAGLRRNAEWIRTGLAKRGVRSTLLEAPGAAPLVFGQLDAAGATQTVVFYAHYDGQPVDPRQWQGSAPFEPSYRGASAEAPDARVFARSASDDKAPIMAMLAALDELRSAGRTPSINIKFVFEGEEEAGSQNLGRLLTKYRAQLQADFWLICDGPVHQTRRMQIYFGARGVTGFQLTVYGPNRELHSGHYGNWAPNPAMNLARLLASMKDDEGRVQIDGFYDGIAPLSEVEIAAMKEEPPVDGDLQRELGIGRTENSPRRLIEVLNQPSFNIRGLASGAVGAASRNVVPATASVSVDIRLVKGNDPARMIDLVRAHIRNLGYLLLEGRDPTEAERLQSPKIARLDANEHGYRAVRTPMDLPVSRRVIAAVEAVHGPVVKMPTLGGSVPLAIIEDALGVPMIGIPIVNHDNNQHSHNENLRLANLWQGIATFVGLFTMPAR